MITEGPTDEEFYKKVLNTIKIVNNGKRFGFDEIKFFCSSGIGNMHKKMLSKFKIEIVPNFEGYDKIVCFCYDKDVFNLNKSNPPINREQMFSDFLEAGATKIIKIEADNMIEDFILMDIDGVKKFLKLPKAYKLPKKHGLALIEQMFKDKSKVYTKGYKVEGLVANLDMKKILGQICYQMKFLCCELGYSCSQDKCNL